MAENLRSSQKIKVNKKYPRSKLRGIWMKDRIAYEAHL
jgi:hypothetical protein